jgi:hypothetical protein
MWTPIFPLVYTGSGGIAISRLKVKVMSVRNLVPFLALLPVLFLISCRPESPSPPAPTPTIIPQDLRASVQELLVDVETAFQAQDGSAFRSRWASDVRDRCSAQEVQAALDNGELSNWEGFRVAAVYLDAEDTQQALAAVTTPRPAGLPEGMGVPFYLPLVLEDGTWHLEFPFPVVASVFGDDRCPFDAVGQMGSPPPAPTPADVEERFRSRHPGLPEHLQEFVSRPPGPDMNFEPYLPDLVPPPGVTHIRSGPSMSISGGVRPRLELGLQDSLITDQDAATLAAYYREQLLDRGWQLEERTDSSMISWTAWTFRDDHGELIQGFLLVWSPGEHRQVELSVVWMQ